jgi:hypothetical protein
VSVAVTVDWEGGYFSEEGLDAMDAFRKSVPDAPLTHFITPAYFTKPNAVPARVADEIKAVLRPNDEVALHVHAWRSLVTRAGVTPRPGPSFLGPAPLMEFPDGDSGYEIELGAYSGDEVRKILATSRELLTGAGIEVKPILRVGGAVAVKHVLEAARAEQLTIDSSASAASDAASDPSRRFFVERVRAVWPAIDAVSQPYWIETAAGRILEMPMHFSDYMSASDLEGVLVKAHELAQRDPSGWAFVDLLFHQETGADFAPKMAAAILAARRRLPDALVFETKSAAAARAIRWLDEKAGAPAPGPPPTR